MPRRLLQKLIPDPATLKNRWFLRPFGDRLTDPQLWTLHRRGVTYAFGLGLAISFIPFPVHMLLACTLAVLIRLNIPVAVTATFFVNPFSIMPLYYFAYRVGLLLLQEPRMRFHFVPTLHWLRYGLAPVWKPFLLGCLVCGVVSGVVGWLLLEGIWRWQVVSRYRARRTQPA
ncbi:MAG: DUF2062 domain-containing protein [Proteobacteria bacterium]|nr:DUF2062 domain-containing protein [Pseudomonadota bacterium]